MESTESCAVLNEPMMLPAAVFTSTAMPDSLAELSSSAPTSVEEKACEPFCAWVSSAPDCCDALRALAIAVLKVAVVRLASAMVPSA